MMQHVHEVPNPPGLINPHVSPELSEVILQSIAKDPDKRFPTASAMTVALAQAMHVAAPSSLRKPGIRNEQTEFNPLQPSRPTSGMTPYPSIMTVSPSAASTPSEQAQFNSSSQLTPARGNQLLQSPTSLPQTQSKRTGRAVYFALIACVVLLVSGLGVFAVPRLLSQQNANTSQNTSASAVGQIAFLASPNAARNTYDQLQISLQHISTPPSGKTYYGWLENSVSEASQIQHWPLQVTNGSVHGTYQSDAHRSDLLSNNTLFLITEEDASSTPTIPSPDLSTHLYYAAITHSTSSTPTYQVKQCPSSGTACI
jgi:eukaryotic-like serine/threonine-protein kinase